MFALISLLVKVIPGLTETVATEVVTEEASKRIETEIDKKVSGKPVTPAEKK